VPVLAAVALMAAAKDPCAPRSMILMGGPIDSRINPTVPNRLAQERSLDWFEHSVLTRVPFPHAGFMRRVYPGFLQLTGFMSMNLDRHVGAHVQLFRHLIAGDGESERSHRAFYREYRAVMDLPADYYLQTVQRVFQEHHLPRGVMESRGRPIDTKAIARTALMTVEGERDDISGLGQTHAAHGLCPRIPAARRAQYTQDGVGHYGVFNGRRWREEIAPRVAAFIRAHDRG
jgi:poly(3-hydroxybutyrate) depolymerase